MSALKLFAIRVSQPLCDFFITSIKAATLKKISFSEQLQYHDENGKLQGSQRKVDKNRLQEIGRYIDSVELSFPNSIILGANYNEEGEVTEDVGVRWTYDQIENNLYSITIPSEAKLAAIIDGQHRLNGFEFISKPERIETELPCSIFFDLPNSYQAFLFATINGNQKRVDKSLALEQFGFNVEDEPQSSWTPEKLAVYFVRQLNFKDSPLKGNIRIAPKISNELKNEVFPEQEKWMVSTATIVVDGILSLISTKPKRDRVEMAQENIWGKRTRLMVEKFKSDKSPLRHLYINKQDEQIFTIIFNFLEAAKETVWKSFDPKSYIFKTVGVQALFDLLKRILDNGIIEDKESFETFLQSAMIYDFTSDSIQASGIARKDIRNALLLSSGLIQNSHLKEDDVAKILSFRK